MKNAIGFQLGPNTQTEGGLVYRNERTNAKSAKNLAILDWYRILRAHYHWPLFEAIRYALWLSR